MRVFAAAVARSSVVRTVIMAALLLSAPATAQKYTISTVAGGTPPPTPVAAVTASIGSVRGTATDSSGNVYFSSLDCVFKIDSGGVLTRMAGSARRGFAGDGGPATSAQLGYPTGLAVDGSGNLYIADMWNNRVRKVSTDGLITTVAGGGHSGDGGQATNASLGNPYGLAVDKSGNLYIAEKVSLRIRKVSPSGIISTVAGNGSYGYSGDGGVATAASFKSPTGVAVDGSGNIYVADNADHRVRRVSPAGIITTFAGNGTASSSGDGGPATSAAILYPIAVTTDGAGNVYIAESYRIRKVSPGGIITAFAGGGSAGDGSPATSASLNTVADVSADASGNVYIGDSMDNKVRKVAANGIITTLAGNGYLSYSGDGGPASSAQLNQPAAVAVDSSGNLYIADDSNSRVRMVSASGTITTVAGTGEYGFSGDSGKAISAKLKTPTGVAVDRSGNLYVADGSGNRVRKVSPQGVITTVAGNGNSGFSGDGGPATSAQLSYPCGLAVDAAGSLFISDTNNQRIRKVSTGGTITTVAGNGVSGYSGDGGPATLAALRGPRDVVVDAAGNIYIADVGNYAVRLVSPGGIITTAAGTGTAGYSGDGGLATSAKLDGAWAVDLDGSGNLYIAGFSYIRVVLTSGVITTVAGIGIPGYSGDGGPATDGQFYSSFGVAVSVAGLVYLADYDANAIRLLTPAVTPLSIVSTSPLPQGVAGTAYSQTLSAQGGASPYTWSLTGGALPAGLSLAASGAISGTPAAAGSFTFTVTVQDKDSAQASAAFTVTIVPQSSCSYSVSPTSEMFSESGGTVSISVTALSGCRWTASSSLSWVTISSGSSGSGSGAVTIQAAANTAAPRSGFMTVAGTSISITQGGPGEAVIRTIAGNGTPGLSGDGGPATSAGIHSPHGVALDLSGNLYIADTDNSRIRKVTPGGVISTVAGTSSGYSGDGGPAVNARLSSPAYVAVDGTGNLYVTETSRLRRISSNGVISTAAGTGTDGMSGDGGPAVNAQLNTPCGVAVDRAGTVYIADSGNHRIRRIGLDGIIATVAGSGAHGYGRLGDGGPATSAELNYPCGVAVDASGNLYFADTGNHSIRKVSTSGIITTVAGTGYGVIFGGDNGPATSADLHSPSDVAVDGAGNLYIADTSNGRVRKVTPDGIITTAAGTNGFGYSGDGGPATRAQLNFPSGLAIDGSGNICIADKSNHRVRFVQVGPAGVLSVTTTSPLTQGPAGLVYFQALQATGGSAPYTWAVTSGSLPDGLTLSAGGYITGTPTAAGSFRFRAQAVDRLGAVAAVTFDLVVSPSITLSITTPSALPDGAVSAPYIESLEATGGNPSYAWELVSGNLPAGLTLTSGGMVSGAPVSSGSFTFTARVSDVTSATASQTFTLTVTAGVIITTVAGNGGFGFSGDGGPGVSAQLYVPNSVKVDGAGNLYIADTRDHRIRKVSPSGIITTVAGSDNWGFSGDGGAATRAELHSPYDVAIDGPGNLYIADSGNHRIRKVSASGTITTLAGTGSPGFSGDGGPAAGAQLNFPYGVAVDVQGNVYVSDSDNYRIRKITPAGTITTIAGNGSLGNAGNGGPATGAELGTPYGLTFDASGNLYAADPVNEEIRKISVDGTISTVAGKRGPAYSGDGDLATKAGIGGPTGVAVDRSGNIYITDTFNHRIRKVTAGGVISTLAGSGAPGYSGDGGPAVSARLNNPAGVAVDQSGNVYIADSVNERIRLVQTVSVSALAIASPSSLPLGAVGASYTYSLSRYGGTAPFTWSLAFGSLPGGLTLAADGKISGTPIASGVFEFTVRLTDGASAAASEVFSLTIAPTCTYALDSTRQSLTTAGGKVMVGVISACAWSASSSLTWATIVSGASGIGSGTVTIQVAPNTGAGRTGSITIAGQTFSISQSGMQCTYSLYPSGQAFPIVGGAGRIAITASSGCTWSTSGLPAWIGITSGASGIGSGAVVYQAAANAGGRRSATFSVAGKTFTVEQASASTPGLGIAGSMAQIASGGGWDTSLTLVNLSSSTGEARLSFHADDGSAPSLPFTFPRQPDLGTMLGAVFDRTLPAGASLVLDTTGGLSENSATGQSQLLTTGGIDGFAIFTYMPSGQAAVVPLEMRDASSYLLAFDNTGGGLDGLGDS